MKFKILMLFPYLAICVDASLSIHSRFFSPRISVSGNLIPNIELTRSWKPFFVRSLSLGYFPNFPLDSIIFAFIFSQSDKQGARSSGNTGAMVRILIFVVVIPVFAWILLYASRYSGLVSNASKEQQIKLLQDEKNILMIEMHHMVKNNLQTVLSLLESQSAFLKGEALDAIKSSHNRVFAISLIHQTLYHFEDGTFVNMLLYIPKLIRFLKDSIDPLNRLEISYEIEIVDFGLVQAVPLGLIINEAVTNAMKYAFKGKSKGFIRVTLSSTGNRRFNLVIKDDGIGLPHDFDLNHINSLGIKLIKGLTEQIDGKLKVINQSGTQIIISDISNDTFSAFRKR